MASDSLTLTFLGTGTSTGVPVIGCDCETCRSTDQRDKRLRCSVLVETDGLTVLVDTSPDLREQMLRTGTRRLDGVLFTHPHADHTAGLDELRRFNGMQEEQIPVWATPHTAEELRQRFAYAFERPFAFFGGKPDLGLTIFEPGDVLDVGGLTVQSIPVMHGTWPIVGFRFGKVAYLTDVKALPEESLVMLRDLDVLILTALRQAPHVAHMSLQEALDLVEVLTPKRAILTHIAHDLGMAATVSPMLPENVELAFDGMTITV